MFVIIDNEPTPKANPRDQIIAFNLDYADQIVIRHGSGPFTLVFEKVTEGDPEPMPVANFETRQQAIDCFTDMMVALQRGDHVWTLSNQKSTITRTTNNP